MVFISSKSEDYPQARKVYDFLTGQGYSCFFSAVTIQKMGNTDYKDAIDNALESADHLVVVTSSRENADSKWVKYERNTFANELLSGRKGGNLLTVACGGLEPNQLPLALRQRQVLRFEIELHQLPCFLPILCGSGEQGDCIQKEGDYLLASSRSAFRSKLRRQLMFRSGLILVLFVGLLGLLWEASVRNSTTPAQNPKTMMLTTDEYKFIMERRGQKFESAY